MTLEHRLQHAARELREVHIDTPPLGSEAPMRGRPKNRPFTAPMLIPLLFVIGGLGAIGVPRGNSEPPKQVDVPAGDVVVPMRSADTPVDAARSGGQTPTVQAELRIIADIVNLRSTSAVATSIAGSSARQVAMPPGPT